MRLRLRPWRLILALAASALMAGPCLAQGLTLALSAGPESIDPHAPANAAQTEALKHLFDPLVWSGPQRELEPALAQSWKPVDPTTWEFRLRQGVRFHDGSEFTAEDVKFSMERAATISGPAAAAPFSRAVNGTSVVDPHTIQVVTDGPAPTLPEDLTRLLIVSRKATEGLTNEAAKQAFASGVAAIGTGPFKFASWTPRKELVLERFDGHWRGPFAWSRIVRREIPSDEARVAELKAGHVDLIAGVPASELPGLEREPKIRIVKVDTPSMFRLEFDFRDRTPQATAKDGAALAQNPLKDGKVREAIDLAIDRAALAEVALEGQAKPANQIIASGAPGFDETLPESKPNLERARQLLSEAGYPDGFKVPLTFTIGHDQGDRAMGTSVARMLSRIGLEVRANGQPVGVFLKGRAQGDYSLILAGPGTNTGEAGSALSTLGHSKRALGAASSANWGGYSNPELDKLLEEAAAEFDAGKRVQLLRNAGALFMKERVALALVSTSFVWAMQKSGVDLPKPRSDGQTLAHDIVPLKK